MNAHAASGRSSGLSAALAQGRVRWDRLAARERRMLTIALAVVAAALLWWVALAPALATLKAAQVQHVKLDAQRAQMQDLQAQAMALQAMPKISGDEARRALEAAIKQALGADAQLSVAGERATVTLKAVSGDALAQWLVMLRNNARLVPHEVRLTRAAAPTPPPAAAPTAAARPLPTAATQTLSAAATASLSPAPAAANAATLWSGTVVLNLPSR
jgi:general secretion pathway protein M